MVRVKPIFTLIKISVLFLFFLSITNAHAQNFNTDINKDFEKAVSLYKAKNYETALVIFQRIAFQKTSNSKLTASEFFICNIYLQTKNYDALDKSVNQFLSNYAGSKYADEVKKILIQSLIDRKDYYKAFGVSIGFLSKSNSIVFWNETKDIAEKIALNYLNSSEVSDISNEFNNSSVKPFLLLITGKLYRKEGNETAAKKAFDEIITNYKNSDEYVLAVSLRNSISTQDRDSNDPVVGVMMSVTDQDGRKIQSVSEILEGIKYAFHENNSSGQDKIGLIIKDLQKDKKLITDQSRNFVEDRQVKCVLGPVFSDDVRNALKEFDGSDLCIISPTATDDDLVSLSKNFYQANPSFSARGKAFAQYLYFVENIRKIAVLNSIDGYSPIIADHFIQEFKKLGGNVVVRETYKSNTYSLSDQMSGISVFANSLDGIYAPLSNQSDATVILSSLVQYGLNLKIFGSQDWYIAKGFETATGLSNKLVFDSDYFINYNDPDFQNFSNDFKKITGREVNRNVLYGYDLAKYIITVIHNTDPTRTNIKFKMESGINVSGFHNDISFDSERINKFINIVRYKDGIFELVEKYRSTK